MRLPRPSSSCWVIEMTERPSRYNLDGENRSEAPGADTGATAGTPPGAKGTQAGQPMPANPMTPIFMMLLMLMVITSPGLRQGMGDAAGGALEPSIGMAGELPLMTMLFAGLIMVTSTTLH